MPQFLHIHIGNCRESGGTLSAHSGGHAKKTSALMIISLKKRHLCSFLLIKKGPL